MTIRECYSMLNGDYDDVIGRLRSERLVQKFLLKFLADGSYELLFRSLGEGNAQEAFRAAHTIKGMCQNLSFTALERSASALTETLRGGELAGYEPHLSAVKEDYERTVAAIKAYAENPES